MIFSKIMPQHTNTTSKLSMEKSVIQGDHVLEEEHKGSHSTSAEGKENSNALFINEILVIIIIININLTFLSCYS